MTMKLLVQFIVSAVLASSLSTASATLAESESLVPIVSFSQDDLPANALAKVLRLIDRLKHKINNETELGINFNKKYLAWCDKSIAQAEKERDYHQGLADKFYADLLESTADIKAAQAKIDELTEALMTTQTRLRNAHQRREKEVADYNQGVIDLEEGIKALGEAIKILQKEMEKNPAALTQIDTSTLNTVLQTFSTMGEALSLDADSAQKLTSLIQSQSKEKDSQPDGGAMYKTSSGEIFELLVDMKRKAEQQLEDMHQDEITAQGAYSALVLELEALEKEQQAGFEEHERAKKQALMVHAESEKHYNRAKADVDHNVQTIKDHEKDCEDTKNHHEQFLKDQAAEIELLDKCIQYINDATGSLGGVQDMTEGGDIYLQKSTSPNALSFIQASATAGTEAQVRGYNMFKAKLVGLIKRMAKKHHSMALAQLGSRVKTMIRYGSEDDFYKVKELIKDMIEKLEEQVAHDTDEKEFCDKEMKDTKKKMEDLGIDIQKLDRLHEASYMREVDIEEWLKAIQDALAKDAAMEAEKSKLFNENARNYYNTLDELKDAIGAVRAAIAMLEKFYGEVPPAQEEEAAATKEGMTAKAETQHEEVMDEAAAPAAAMAQMDTRPILVQQAEAGNATAKKQTMQGHGIIEMLTLIEDDLAVSIEHEQAMLDSLNADYAKVMDEYLLSRQMNQQDMQYGKKDADMQHKETGEYGEDEGNKLTEKEKVALYYLQLRDRCIARPERFDDRKKARDDEIAGLKEALRILRDEAAVLVQEKERAARLRGFRRHHFQSELS